MRELLADLHDNFKTTVRHARGAKLDTSDEEELWSGRAWTGRQAAKLGLIDGVGTLQEVMRAKFGDQVMTGTRIRMLFAAWALLLRLTCCSM